MAGNLTYDVKDHRGNAKKKNHNTKKPACLLFELDFTDDIDPETREN